MNSSDFERSMRELEYYHSVRIVPGTWIVLRVDGHGFSRFTEERYQKPFDPKFRDLMIETARALFEGLHALYAYTESDEISILLSPRRDLFNREHEKLVSLSAGMASAAFTHACGEPAHFDSRVWIGVDEERVVDYFQWRQSDATRCALNGWCYWTLRQSGSSIAEATRALERLPVSDKNELLFQHGINFNEVPLWQRRGIGLHTEEYMKDGYDPVAQQSVTATRRRTKVNMELPMKDEYRPFIVRLLPQAENRECA
jgi:tRNA(His) guanylyltransferase